MPEGRRVIFMSMEREVAAPGGAGFLSQRYLDARQMADWVNVLAPWYVIAHHTFRWTGSSDSARRVFERFMSKELPRVSYFYAIERNPGRDGYHVHALWADCHSVFRKEVWAKWFKRFGRARIEVVRRYEQVSSYCAKYVTKEGAWWNVKLQWHRVQALNDDNFRLRDEPACSSYDAGVQVVADPRVEPGAPAASEAAEIGSFKCGPSSWYDVWYPPEEWTPG